MSLKTLISVSGRLTGDPSSCQKNFILFSKEFKAAFLDSLLQFQLEFNTINRKVWSRVFGREILTHSSKSKAKQFIMRLSTKHSE